MIETLTRKQWKIKHVQRSGDQGQQVVESGVKVVPVTILALGTNKEGLDQKRQLLPGHRQP